MAQARLTTCYPLLGRMIVAARQAGDLHDTDHGRIASDDPTLSLTDLGIGRDLAAHAVRLAAVPAEPCATEPPEHAPRCTGARGLGYSVRENPAQRDSGLK